MPNTPNWTQNLLPGSSELIDSVAISGDGSKVVAGTYFYVVTPPGGTAPTNKVGLFVYDNSGTLKWSDEFPATRGFNSVAISRDGNWVAGSGQITASQGLIRVYSSNSKQPKLESKPADLVASIALNSDGSVMAAGGDSLYVSTRTGTAWNAPQSLRLPGSAVSVAISGDGKWIAAGLDGGLVMLVKNAGGTLTPFGPWKLNNYHILQVAFAANGLGFAAAAGEDHSVYWFDVQAFSTTQPPTFSWRENLAGCTSCRSVAVSDDASIVAAVGGAQGSGTGSLFLFENKGKSAKKKWPQAKPLAQSPNMVTVDAQANYIAVATGFYQPGTQPGPGSLTLFDKTGNPKWSFPTTGTTRPVQISANGNAMIGGVDAPNIYDFSVP